MRNRDGIVIGGTLVLDWVKTVDTFPSEGTLSYILDVHRSTGGCPTNNSINLKVLDPDLSVSVIGAVGDDEDGAYIVNKLRRHGIDVSGICTTSKQPTCSTDVIAAKDSGQRTFFHYRGANSQWGFEDIPFERYSNFKIVQIGYILVLDKMDEQDPEYGTVMAKTLARFQQMGLKTSVDVVSENSDRFAQKVIPALKYVDYLILNEFEAGKTVGIELRGDDDELLGGRLRETAEKLLESGNSELVVIHMPEGGYGLTRTGEEIKVPSYLLDTRDITGSVGAGDAFCSGVLYGLLKEMHLKKALELGTTMAACNLFSPTASGGAVSLEDAYKKMSAYQLRPLVF